MTRPIKLLILYDTSAITHVADYTICSEWVVDSEERYCGPQMFIIINTITLPVLQLHNYYYYKIITITLLLLSRAIVYQINER